MPAGEWGTGRFSAGQCQTNLVRQIGFVFFGTITNQNKRFNHKFKEGVVDLVSTQHQRAPSDFISVAQAQEQILLQTGRTVSHSTAARWIGQNHLGHKLQGRKGQWIVDKHLLSSFLEN